MRRPRLPGAGPGRGRAAGTPWRRHPCAAIPLDEGRGSGAVAALELLAAAAPAWVVAPDLGRIGRPTRRAAGGHRLIAVLVLDGAGAGRRRGQAGQHRRRRRGGVRGDLWALAVAIPGAGACAGGRAHLRGGRLRHGRRRPDGDPEDRVGHLVADEAAQLLVELECLALELVERVDAAVAPEADAAPHVVQLGQVLYPQAVDRAQQDDSLDVAPDVRPVLLLAALDRLLDRIAQVLQDFLAHRDLGQVVGVESI